MPNRRVAIIDGFRTPFTRVFTDFREMTAIDLAKVCLAELVNRTEIDPREIDEIAMGISIPKPSTTNLARIAALGIGLPKTIHSYHMQLACASSILTTAHVAMSIMTGNADVGIAGGAESMSDVPITVTEPFRRVILEAQTKKTPEEQMLTIGQVRLLDMIPPPLALAEAYTGLTMGEHTELMVKEWGITREEQDEYAARTHELAGKAVADGRIPAEVIPVPAPPDYHIAQTDNLVRPQPNRPKIASLPPAFDKEYGTITAANSSPLTDGASAVLLMTEEKAKALGYKPKAYIRSFGFSGLDLDVGMLFGPTFSTPKALRRAGLKLADIDLVEMHEAFAGQVLCNLRAFNSKAWLEKNVGLSEPIGEVNMERLNMMGGSVSLGHPFGATGARMITTCANQLPRVDGTFGLVTACAANGTGGAMILERAD
ncbi:MAG: acetyl-CoA C-acyltransferase [Desulfobacterales bacterium]|nr:MAG: acetyl-CoA C-acyltransferase [Desulfobacterales bacterium]